MVVVVVGRHSSPLLKAFRQSGLTQTEVEAAERERKVLNTLNIILMETRNL